MSTITATHFLSAFLGDAAMQQQLAARIIEDRTLTFAHWQHIATGHGWNFAEADFDAALAADPALMPTLERLAETHHLWQYLDVDFELSEAELETIAGGAKPTCNPPSGQGNVNRTSNPKFKA